MSRYKSRGIPSESSPNLFVEESLHPDYQSGSSVTKATNVTSIGNINQHPEPPVSPMYIQGPSSPISKPSVNIRRIVSTNSIGREVPKEKFNRVRVQDLLNTSTPSTPPPMHTHQHHIISPSTTVLPSSHAVNALFDSTKNSTPYLCDYPDCHRKFGSSSSRLIHYRRAHAAPTAFVCRHCGSSFSTSPNLNKHVKSVHEKVKPFQCELCNATFAFRDGLQRHVRMVHDALRPYACKFCTVRFKSRNHMAKHVWSRHPNEYIAHSGWDIDRDEVDGSRQPNSDSHSNSNSQ